MKLVTEKLRTYAIVRPASGLGTCGFSPKPWQAGIIKRNESPKMAFLRANPNWTIEELDQ